MTDAKLKSLAERKPVHGIIARLLDSRQRVAAIDRELRALYRQAAKELKLTTAELEMEIIRLREADKRFAKNKVYFARLLSRDAVKIGVTGNLEARIPQLRFALNSPIKLVGSIDGDGVTERVIQHQLRAHCLSGELFHWSPIRATVQDMIIRNSALVRA